MTQSVEQTSWQHYYRRTDDKTNSKNDTAYLIACQCPLMKYRSSSFRSNDGIYYLRMNFPVRTQAHTIQKSSHPRALTIHFRVHNLAIRNNVGSTINKMLPSTSSCATLGGLTRFTTSPSGGDAAIIGVLDTSGAMVIEPCRAPLDPTIKLEQDGEETTERPVHKVSPPCLRHQVASKSGNALLPERKPLRVLPFYPQTLNPCPHRTRNHPSTIRSFISENPQPAILQHLRVLALSKFLSLLGS
jgi:hypothetical protein